MNCVLILTPVVLGIRAASAVNLS